MAARIDEPFLIKEEQIDAGSWIELFEVLFSFDRDFMFQQGRVALGGAADGLLENIRVSSIVMNNVEGPLFIRLGNRGRSYEAPTEQVYGAAVKAEGLPPGIMRNIRISNIQATVVSDQPERCGVFISGIPGHLVEDVVLENIQITYPGGGTAEQAQRVVAEDEARYPEAFFFGTLPSWGAYIRHARSITFRNVTMAVRSPDQRQKIVQVGVEGFVAE